ncbi:alpha/beta hydrolase [Acidimangrovimonas pyrenivorans]|uniref:Alpha/beta hydrolase n=1 Tax=Acidimangrovimonas pyrenivorans TaxID=2030798 RepID=A0ABV7AHV8_9RHOB
MPLIAVNAIADAPVAAESRPLDAVLAGALAALPAGAPIMVMLHGFRFSPTVIGQSPHSHILSLEPDPQCWKALSWPRHLGFEGAAQEGLAIAFGWEARGTLWRAYDEAALAGRALATLLNRIAALAPGRRVGALAHSLGARVLLQALPHLDSPAVDSAVLLAAAEFRSRAAAALASPAGRAVEIVNVTSRENALYDLMIETLIPRPRDRTLGRGLPGPSRRWLDLPLDHAPTLAALSGLGHPVAPPGRRACHWSTYLRPGVFGLYRALLEGELALGALRAALPTPANTPLRRRDRPAPLPPAQDAPV